MYLCVEVVYCLFSLWQDVGGAASAAGLARDKLLERQEKLEVGYKYTCI